MRTASKAPRRSKGRAARTRSAAAGRARLDEKLVARVRRSLRRGAPAEERRMFGGVAFLLRGHMCCGVIGRDLMVRVGPEGYEEVLRKPHARPMDFTGRPLPGFVYVGPAGLRSAPALSAWIARGVGFVATLPRKSAGM
ncbi:MAG: TfoX/Sxy family protein [Thermoanaerobaculia bacterium]